jgi:hypothetical protein
MRFRPTLLTLIMLVGAVLRLWGIFHGLADGLIYHADAYLSAFTAPGTSIAGRRSRWRTPRTDHAVAAG